MCSFKISLALMAFILLNLLVNGQKICEMPKDTGPCRGCMKSFFFDNDAQACKQFEFGGCGGNENRFKTIEECESLCLPLADKR